MSKVKLSPKFQVVIPQVVREKLDLKPGEKIVLETVGPDGDTAYWHDANDVHHVPKRKLDDIIID